MAKGKYNKLFKRDKIKHSINAICITIGGVIALQGLDIKFIYSLIISLACIFIASHFLGKNIKNAVHDGTLSKAELQSAIFKSPYLWVGVVTFVVLVVFV